MADKAQEIIKANGYSNGTNVYDDLKTVFRPGLNSQLIRYFSPCIKL